MIIGIALIELVDSLVFLLLGSYFYKAKDPERCVMFLAGDFSGLDMKRICKDTGKRIFSWAALFILGIIIDFFNPLLSIQVVSIVFTILLLFHIADITLNRRRKYKLKK